MSELSHATLIRPKQGETGCGDRALALVLEGGELLLAIIDVAGHGAIADEVAADIERLITARADEQPSKLLQRLHDHLRGSRSAAVGLCRVDPGRERLLYSGIGNTAMRVYGPRTRHGVGRDGMVGETMPKPREEDIPLDPGDVIVLHTDGLSSRFGPDDYPGLMRDDPEQTVRRLIERFGKAHDDAACVVAKIPS